MSDPIQADDKIPRQPEKIYCRRCGNQIGEEVLIVGIMHVHAGGGLWQQLRGNCTNCGEPFYWSDNSIKVARHLMRKADQSHAD
jgi:hypothetical protein